MSMGKRFLGLNLDEMNAEVKTLLPDVSTEDLYRLRSMIDSELNKPHRRDEMRVFNNGQSV